MSTTVQMPLPLDFDNDAAWQTQIRVRIMKNLDGLLQEAYMAHKTKIAQTIFAAPETRHQLELKYQQEVQHLKYMAEQEVQAEIERGEQERKWSRESTWDTLDNPDDITQALIEEQISILKQIRSNPSSPLTDKHEFQGTSFRESSSQSSFYESQSSRQSPVRDTSSTPASAIYSHFSPSPVSSRSVESPVDKEARLRAEKHERQQEEYRKKADAILQRKRLERQWAESMSSSSSTTSVSEDSDNPKAADPDFMIPMNEEDINSLMIFHEQQWSWISSLPHLEWTDFPWPVLSFSSPMRKDELTTEAVVQYIFAPIKARHDRTAVKDRLKELIKRWHPDRFETKYLALIVGLHEREKVREGAGIVARILNDLLGKWNDL